MYLASTRLPHRLVGQAALAGFIGVGLFPRLGALGTIADFLEQDQEFLDRASSTSELRRTVWDVNWGSVFPCANGAVASILSAYILRDADIKSVPEEIPTLKPAGSNQSSAATSLSSITGATSSDPRFRRHQTLHILHFSAPARTVPSTSSIIASNAFAICLEVLALVTLVGVGVVCLFYGLFGTSAAIFLTALFRVGRQLIKIERPSGYLHNNEGDLPGCMLMAIHENASTWYLYIGSRAVIDTILNKSMVQSIKSPLGLWLARGFRTLEFLQLIIMGYVAAQKGWDGIALLCLILVAWMFDLVAYSDTRVAASWLHRENITVKPMSLRFGGRTPMIGVIHALGNKTVTSWMDAILSPSDRRNVWLQKIGLQVVDTELEKRLSYRDREWVQLNERMTEAALWAIGDIGSGQDV